MLGIIVGVASLIAVFAIGYGGRVLVVKEVENFWEQSYSLLAAIMCLGTQQFLMAEDTDFMLSRCPDCVSAVPVIYQTMQAQAGNKSQYLWLMGTFPVYKDVRNTTLLSLTRSHRTITKSAAKCA